VRHGAKQTPTDERSIRYSKRADVSLAQVLSLYRANNWSAAEKPRQLHRALKHSHTLVTAWCGKQLVGLGNAISDGSLVVYYPHLLVHPEHQGRGIGQRMLRILSLRYAKFHQQVVVAEPQAVGLYRKFGFKPAGKAEALEIFQGHEHALEA
jgi:GNAT superfamily N-acetyltransferase